MKLRLSALVEDARGKDGNLVIRKGRSGPIATPRVTPRNPKSVGQLKSRGAMDKSSKTFAGMTSAQVAAWNAFGATQVRHDAVSGKSYTATGIAAFNELATKFLQATPGGTVPLTPPTTAFAGDNVTFTATPGTGQVTITASAANATGVKTEILAQQLKGKNRKPYAKAYVSKAYFTFAGTGLTTTITLPPGYWSVATRFVLSATGQATEIVPLPTQTVALALEDGGVGEDEGFEQKAA